MIYPVITLYQPWATWIIRGWKTIETRTHNRFASLLGKDILIHAGQNTDASAILNPYLSDEKKLYKPEEVVNGVILGKAHVWLFRQLNDTHSDASLIECANTKRWGLFLSHIDQFKDPIPVKGSMGIWYYDLQEKRAVAKPHNQSATLF